jgi:hypothetical protein
MGLINSSDFELNADNGPLVIRVAIAMMAISLLGAVLRFMARRIVRQPIMWDDWFIVLGLVCSWGVCIIQIIGMGSTSASVRKVLSTSLINLSSCAVWKLRSPCSTYYTNSASTLLEISLRSSDCISFWDRISQVLHIILLQAPIQGSASKDASDHLRRCCSGLVASYGTPSTKPDSTVS